jgi:hypothetical protein
VSSSPSQQDHSVAAYCLLLPGKILHLSALLNAKRFRDKGNKEGAVRAFKLLQEAGLGKVIENKPSRGATMVRIIFYTCTYGDTCRSQSGNVRLFGFFCLVRLIVYAQAIICLKEVSSLTSGGIVRMLAVIATSNIQ